MRSLFLIFWESEIGVEQKWLVVESEARKKSDLKKLEKKVTKDSAKAQEILTSLVREKFTSSTKFKRINPIKKSTTSALKKLLKYFAIQLVKSSIPELTNYGETRYIAIGSNSRMTIMTVVYTQRERRIRLISARRANKQEKGLYYEYCT